MLKHGEVREYLHSSETEKGITMQRHVTELIDDIDNTPAVKTITFAVDGVTYEIDLNQSHVDQFHDSIKPWTDAARRAPKATSTKNQNQTDPAAIRAWAIAQGMQVSARGRVSQEVRDAYEAAH